MNKKRTYYLKKEIPLISALFTVSILLAVCIAYSVYLWKLIYDQLFLEPDRAQFIKITMLSLGSVVTVGILRMGYDTLFTLLNRRLFNRIRNDFISEVMSYPYPFFLDHHSSVFAKSSTEDCRIIAEGLSNGVMGIINLLQISFWLVFFQFIFPLASLVYLSIVVIFVIWIIIWRKKFELASYNVGKAYDSVWRTLLEIFSGIKIIKLELLKKKILAQADEDFGNLSKTHNISQFYSNMMWNIFYLLPWLAIGSILVLLLKRIQTGDYTVGILVFCLLFTERFLTPLNESIHILVSRQGLKVAEERLKQYCNKDLETGGIRVLDAVKNEIVFKDVNFSYPGTHFMLRNININIPAGKNIGIFGKSGSGKSTLASLLLRLFEPDSGNIFIDGISAHSYTLESLRKNIVLVPQEIPIYLGSLRENIDIRMCKSDDDLMKIINMVRLTDFVNRMPNGLGTRITIDGLDISGGERQRLGLARAMTLGGTVMVYDEITASLDKETERDIVNSLYDHPENISTITITHNPEILKLLDSVYFLDNETIYEGAI